MRAISAFLILLFTVPAFAAPPKIESVFPAGARGGESATVMLTGEFSQWPLATWSDRTNVAFTCEAEKGKLRIDASQAQRGGCVRFRLLGDEGPSALQTIVLGEAPEFTEIEPNLDPKSANAIAVPVTINGRLSEKGDVDAFRIDLKAGQTLSAVCQAHSVLGSPIDAVLQACRLVRRPASVLGEEPEEAFVLEQNHDGLGLDPVLTFRAPSDGTYLIRLFSFAAEPNSSIEYFSSGAAAYRLTLTTEAVSLDSFTPEITGRFREVNLGSIQPETPPFTFVGEFRNPREEFTIALAGTKKQKLTFAARSREFGSRADLRFEVLDAEGKTLVSGNQADPRKSTETPFNPPSDGEYRVRVRELFSRGGAEYRFRLSVIGANHEFEVNAAKETFAFESDAIEIPLTIDRRFGFAGPITIEANELPPGISGEKAISEEKGDSSKSVKLKLARSAEAKPGTYRFAVIGRGGEPAIERYSEYSTGKALDVKQRDFWVTVPKN